MDGKSDRAAARPAMSSVHTDSTRAGPSIVTQFINTAEATQEPHTNLLNLAHNLATHKLFQCARGAVSTSNAEFCI